MSSTRSVIATDHAPGAIGPYSQAVKNGGVLYCSGQIPLKPGASSLEGGSLGEQTTQCLENLTALCRAAGTELARAARMTVYTTNLEGFGEINEAYGAFFGEEPPARVTIGVAALPMGAQVEIDAVVAAD
jgi:2-iminobutanoate/2-iminopropanoate deaminase